MKTRRFDCVKCGNYIVVSGKTTDKIADDVTFSHGWLFVNRNTFKCICHKCYILETAYISKR